jgi:hypothetical protein
MRAVAFDVVKEDGRLKMLNPTVFKRYVESLPSKKILKMKIENAKGATVSDPLRRYYFAVVAAMIAEETGHSRDAIHEALKQKVLGYVDEKTGLTMVPSVFSDGSTLTVQEKRAFVDEVRRWAFDFLNLVIPDPETAVY